MENKREIFHVLTRRFGLLDKNCCSVGSFEISTIQSHILYEIDRQHEPSMQQIAQILTMDITTFSRQIQTLVNMDLVKKTPSSQDKRVSILSLSVQGKFVATSIDHAMNVYLDEVFSHMDENEREMVIRSIKLLNEAMSKSSVCCTPLY
ncbi:DNA-binding MarR family transcriptional regulator [Ureibacillus xyleni]|uniref:DNA-binding MarR family transcriptional regulator n=1 Tax=Ureibacillus xyleni TaxID=614648 RepID=A0A285TNS6_9BACL|nr:MarR family winged helix-turn-helix transcriptional regulator [Ureibacillus xyleni]SOC22483.1 DNA-binding MarR family transcriptional regulator [Ureibacillus xyleni]